MLGSSFMYPAFGFAGLKDCVEFKALRGGLLSTCLLELLSNKYQKQLIFPICQTYRTKGFRHISLLLPIISLQNRYYY